MTTPNQNIPTPRTELALCRYTGGKPVTFPCGLRTLVPSDLARQLERELTEKDNAIAALRKVESGLRQALLTYEGQTHFICECGGTKLAEERLAKLEQVAEGLARDLRDSFITSTSTLNYQSYLKSKGETK